LLEPTCWTFCLESPVEALQFHLRKSALKNKFSCFLRLVLQAFSSFTFKST